MVVVKFGKIGSNYFFNCKICSLKSLYFYLACNLTEYCRLDV